MHRPKVPSHFVCTSVGHNIGDCHILEGPPFMKGHPTLEGPEYDLPLFDICMKLIWLAHDLGEAHGRFVRPAWRLTLCASQSEGFGLDGGALISTALRGSCGMGKPTDAVSE